MRKVGSVSKLGISDKTIYSIDDMLYINSYHKTIEKLYKFLKLYYTWSISSNTKMSYTQLRTKHAMDSHLLPVLKKYGYANDSSLWIFHQFPSKADALFIQLKIREYYKNQKSNE